MNDLLFFSQSAWKAPQIRSKSAQKEKDQNPLKIRLNLLSRF
jgi:hypothetical protein